MTAATTQLAASVPNTEREDEEESSPGQTVDDVEGVVLVLEGGGWQRPDAALAMNSGLSWKFHLEAVDGPGVLHVHLADVLRSYIIDRLRSAYDDGHEVHLALPLEAMYDTTVQQVLAQFDAHIHLITNEGVVRGTHHLDALVASGVPVSPSMRTTIARSAWARRDRGTNQQKGRFFEALLAFLFEQVPDFSVVERNYRGDSDEVDLWIQIDKWSKRVWQENGVPFILVEGKNRAEKSGAPFVSHLKSQLRSKHRRTRIGILCSTSPFTTDATLEVVKLAESEFSVALLGPAELEAWIEADDGTEYLEAIVRKAMIR